VSTLSESECPILKGGPPLQAKPEGWPHRSLCFDFQYLSWYSISEIIFELASGCRVSWNSVGFLMNKKFTILVIVSHLKFKKRLKRRHNEDPQETAFSSSIRSSGQPSPGSRMKVEHFLQCLGRRHPPPPNFPGSGRGGGAGDIHLTQILKL
jgi:hypothetical protein